MGIYNYYSRHVSLPVADLITGRNISKYLYFLNQSQYWTYDEIVSYQNRKLMLLIKHAYNNVPFYTDILNQSNLVPEDIQTIEDLRKFPILSKNDLREGIRSGLLFDRTAKLTKLEKNSSSGSTGEPLQFYLDKKTASIKKATSIRGWEWMGFKLGDKILRISQIPRRGVMKKIQDYMSRSRYIMASRLNAEEFQKIVLTLNITKPKVLRCYAEPLFLLAQYIRETNAQIHQVEIINTTGSTLLPEYRELIESVFRCKIFDSFSCEGGAVVFECPTHTLYHSADEYAITEVVDSEGNPSRIGRLITTDLWNYATPFIRYDTQDVVDTSGGECNCGRHLKPINRIYGRSSDILVTPNKQYLTVNNFTGLFQSISGIDQFQIIQKSIDDFDILLKINSKFNQDSRAQVLGIMQKIIREEVKISIDVVQDIPLTPNGKRRFLIRDSSIPLSL